MDHHEERYNILQKALENPGARHVSSAIKYVPHYSYHDYMRYPSKLIVGKLMATT
jgi:hypothetical protein